MIKALFYMILGGLLTIAGLIFLIIKYPGIVSFLIW